MPAQPSPSDPLRQLLDEAETELSRRLHEACEAEAQGVSTESTAEIRRLEDTLLSAAMAAERTIVARRHLNESARAEPAREEAAHEAVPAPNQAIARADGVPAPDASGSCPIVAGTVVRQFEDETGRRWRAWPVVPDTGRVREHSRRTLGEFQDGWICFEALDNSGRRRLPGRADGWDDLSGEALVRLLTRAITVPARKPRPVELQQAIETTRDADVRGAR